MTLGTKLRQARTDAGLTQEQLASKLMVSRQAITKWESDKGMPDVSNLRALASLLNVSVDYLLDDEKQLSDSVIRESCDLSKYGRGRRKVKKDRLMRERYPGAKLITLVPYPVLTKSERLIDNLLGFFTDAPFGIPTLILQLRNLDKEYYLVEENGEQYMVMVTDEFIETRRMPAPVTEKTFVIGEWKFVRCAGEINGK